MNKSNLLKTMVHNAVFAHLGGFLICMHLTRHANQRAIPTKSEIEAYLDGNICRCTGYKPILKAFHSFSNPTSSSHSHDHEGCDGICSSTKDQCLSRGCFGGDVEDTYNGQNHKSYPDASTCVGKKSNPLGPKLRDRDRMLVNSYDPQPLMFFNPATNKRWIRPVTLEQLCAVMRDYANETVQIVGGNTSIGVTKYLNNSGPYNTADNYNVYVDVNSVSIMTTNIYDSVTNSLTVGAATPINTLISLLKQYATPSAPSELLVNHKSVFSVTAHHLSLIANSQVRNAGTWAGNLMVFLRYPEFPSDAVLALATAGVKVQVANSYGEIIVLDMPTFLNYSIQNFTAQGFFIVSMTIEESVLNPALRLQETITETFKVAQRTRNAHAHVNAGFQFHILRQLNSAPLCLHARIVYGGVSKKTFFATRTQKYLTNVKLDAKTLSGALVELQNDLNAVGKSEEYGDQLFKESVMQSFLYRAFLRCYPIHELPSNVVSAVMPWIKPISRGTEIYQPASDDDTPVGKPIKKLEANIQATGEAIYPSDEPLPPQGLHGAIVYSTRCAVALSGIDTTQALSYPGVVSVLTAADIPGTNTVGSGIYLFVPIGEQVKCVGAPLAVVVATTEAIANKAASLVNVYYQDIGLVPITNIEQAITQQSFFNDIPESYTLIEAGDPDGAMKTSYRSVKGRISAGGQYHFYMETQTAIAKIVDGEFIDVTCGSQDPSGYQNQISNMLSIPQNKVIVKCPRAGGAFGGKITGGVTNAAAAALCTTKLGRPVRIFNLRSADMQMQGGREAWIVDYEVGFAADGTITALKYDFYLDGGIASGDLVGSVAMGMMWADNAYYFPNYRANAKGCYTNTPARTSMRAPGVVQACLTTEIIIERVAKELNVPISTIQNKNFIADGKTTIMGQPINNCTLPTIWNTLVNRSRIAEREYRVNQYNATNLWRKRGIAICPVKYGMGWAYYNAGVRIGVRQTDGSVIVSHNGCEIGQGINTKVAQAVAMALQIDISLIRVTGAATDKVTNGGVTGGSGTSEVVVQAALNACDTLNKRLDPYRPAKKKRVNQTMSNAAWTDLLASLSPEVSLNVEGWYSPTENPNKQPFQYFVYAACVTEIELDVMTGQVHVLACEMTYDCGQSLNPAVDIGQIEGALVMGLGYFLTERVEYDLNSGVLLTNGTWEYKPPMTQEVPAVMNLTLMKNMYNKDGILGSKAVGEPPYVIANSIYFALKMAITSARSDAGESGFFALDVPSTVNLRQKACLVTPERFVMPF